MKLSLYAGAAFAIITSVVTFDRARAAEPWPGNPLPPMERTSLSLSNAWPTFILPNSEGGIFTSESLLGVRSTDILLLASDVKDEGIATSVNRELLNTFLQTSRVHPLHMENRRTLVVVTSDLGLTRPAPLQAPDTLVRDAERTLLSKFTQKPTSSLIVSVDRAGFIRRVEPVSSPADVQQLLAASPVETPLEEGQPAPEFSVTDSAGTPRSLSDLQGRSNLLLTFFPKCFTGGCISHLSSLQRELSALADANTEVWAVSVDPAEGAKGQRAFAASLGINFPLIPDTGRNLSILFGAANSPNQFAARMSVFIDKKGVIRWIDKQINVKTYGPDVLRKIEHVTRAGVSPTSNHRSTTLCGCSR
jgi:peroxiredoxin